MKFRHTVYIVTALMLFAIPGHRTLATESLDQWGIAAGYRVARIPFPTSEQQVSDFIPLLYYQGEQFFIHGLTGGVHLFEHNNWQFNLLGQYRFFDIPAEFQNTIRGNGLDIGLQARYSFSGKLEASVDTLADDDGRSYFRLNSQYRWESGSWELEPYTSLRWKSADFNNHYYGLDGTEDPDNPGNFLDNKIGSGLDLAIGAELRLHVSSNLYVIGNVKVTTQDNNTLASPTIENRTHGEIYLGIGFFEDKGKISVHSRSRLRNKPYLRIAHGRATPSNIGDIVIDFDTEPDLQKNQMSSVFYGHPVADSLFGIPLNIYITPGFVYHHASSPFTNTLEPGEGINTGTTPLTITYNSQPTTEYVIAIKADYEFKWPVRWRAGLAEGLSYVDDITNIEQREMDLKGYRGSNLLNYMDFSVDINLGDVSGNSAMKQLWLGYSLHHRSAIFETSSAFGRIKGGSNYNTLYLQYHW